MRKEALLIPLLIAVVFITACENIDVSKLSDKDLERISEKLIVCNPPYIRYASDCCLDQNDNKVCDKDERELTSEEKENEDEINKETPSGIQPPVEETPAEPTHPETPEPKDEAFQEKCTLPAGIGCIDFKVSSSSVVVTLRNGLGFDIATVIIATSGCEAIITPLLENGGVATYTIPCTLTGSKYDGQLNVTYTNAETYLVHKVQGTITAKITN